MIFGIFGKTKPPPLTAFCIKLSVPENLLKLVDSMTKDTSSSIAKRAIVLSSLIMGGAGHFVEKLQWDREGILEGSQRYLRDTNLDVITAEAIVWIHFLMERFWLADQKKDHEMFERVGLGTFREAFELALCTIEKQTGCDFRARSIESRKLYLEAMKERGLCSEPFANTVLQSVGCRTAQDGRPIVPTTHSP
jgi:hypothetical protein